MNEPLGGSSPISPIRTWFLLNFGTSLAQKWGKIPEMSNQQSCRCGTLVPLELESVGQCVTHFISSLEQTCAQMHREIVLCGVDPEREGAVARYITECAQLLARVSSNLPLPDELKRRVLSSFLCLMNLRETLDRGRSVRLVKLRSSDSAAVARSAVAAS